MSAVNEKGSKVAVTKVERTEKITVGVDKSDAVVLQLNGDDGIELNWDPRAFRKLPSEVVEKLRPVNMKAYLVAENEYERVQRAVKSVVLGPDPLGPTGGYSQAREYVRPRRGWHQAWANPGRDFDTKMRGPYRQVREPTAEQEKKGYEPGEESGEVLKRMTGDGKVEAIAVECPQDLYEARLNWASEKSGARKMEVKQDFFAAVENINRELPRDSRVMPIDYDGDIQV